jgi:hypothetical protein
MREQDMQTRSSWLSRPLLSGAELRHADRTSIQCKVFYTSLDGQGEGTIGNLSRNGCLVEGDMPVKEGDKLTLVFHHPAIPHLIVIDKARVVWLEGRKFGLVHETVYPSELAHLNALLSHSSLFERTLSAGVPGHTP